VNEKEEGRGGKVPAEIANDLEKFAEFLDPHQSDSLEVEESRSTKRWSVLKAAIYILGTSLVVWALILALVYYLLWQ
jgi:hypothetical protein